jgi:hypothetical protein
MAKMKETTPTFIYGVYMGWTHPASFGIKPDNNTNRRQSCSPNKDGSTTAQVGGRIFVAKTVVDTAIRTPWL